mmetsp:Transcript_5939/g.10682  ORF Transcript_5939/g.10682 Transcript_5939/m.10682 type:complete len:257 (-) Transcript_5939:145-915(-)
MDGSLCFLNDHLVSTAQEYSDRFHALTLLQHNHAIPSGTKRHFPDPLCHAQFLRGDFLKSRDNTSTRCDGDKLNLYSSHPSDRGQVVLKQKVVCLIIKAPLANNQGRARILHLLHHILKVCLFRHLHFLIGLYILNFQLMLGLWFWRLKRTGEDAYFCVIHLFRHLRVGEILIDHDTMHQDGIFQLPPHFALDFDEIEVDFLSFHICNCKDSVDADLTQLFAHTMDDLGVERGHSDFPQLFVIILLVIHLVRDGLQ